MGYKGIWSESFGALGPKMSLRNFSRTSPYNNIFFFRMNSKYSSSRNDRALYNFLPAGPRVLKCEKKKKLHIYEKIIQEWSKWNLWDIAFKEFEVNRPHHLKFLKGVVCNFLLRIFWALSLVYTNNIESLPFCIGTDLSEFKTMKTKKKKKMFENNNK